MSGSFYDILEVSPRASQEVIHAAFKALMKKYHPDKSSNPTVGRAAQKISEAYSTLSNADKRSTYDASLGSVAGKVIGEFRVESKIADGGFGTTYKGSHITVGEPVCIKHCSHISAVDSALLIEEAKAMWDLRHFAIPAVRNLLKLDDGSLALVMSYVPGPTLAQIVEKYASRGEKLDPEDVAWITQRILNALSYIHRNGVVHGDLKPQNIIIQPDSHMAVLVDFGLAAIKPTRSSESKGYTEVFAPPEQVKGAPLIPQTDFYSLGMTMIYALTGGDENRLQNKQVPASVPEPLCRFINRMIVREPLGRPDWARENLLTTIERVRQESFGRTSTEMRALRL